jgi:CubicO group peptidase (beta-lactamase class C family)
MRHLERPVSRLARRFFVGAIIVSASLVAAGQRAVDESLPALLPDSELRDELLFRADELPRLRSLLVSVDGQLVEEHYYHGATASRLANVKSVSKSIISLLVGIAIDRGHIAGVDQSVADYFQEYFRPGTNLEHTEITVGDLLSMQAGLETTSNRNYGRWVQSANWIHHILTRPIVGRPGGRRIYSTGNTHLLSAILAKASGVNTLEFARRRLAEPLGFVLPAWHQDPQGIYFGGNEMQMTPRSMISIGQLVLSCGMHNGIQIVSEDWVHQSLEPRSRSERSGREYGYGWWMRSLAAYQTYYAWGYGGQFIFVVPKLSLVVVTTSSPNPGDGRRAHLTSLYSLVEDQIIPAVNQRNKDLARRLASGE